MHYAEAVLLAGSVALVAIAPAVLYLLGRLP
jgi:hypothetical protein